MIIEIKDLPVNRNVKKVTFDIEFEDGEVSSVKPNLESTQVNEEVVTTHTEIPCTQDTESKVTAPIIEENRPKKAIPQEMQDLEF